MQSDSLMPFVVFVAIREDLNALDWINSGFRVILDFGSSTRWILKTVIRESGGSALAINSPQVQLQEWDCGFQPIPEIIRSMWVGLIRISPMMSKEQAQVSENGGTSSELFFGGTVISLSLSF